jgi:DNA modification methylase
MTSKIPQELLDYLHTMIIPDGGEALVLLDGLEKANFVALPDNHYHGIIARGTPTIEQSAQMERILRPGGHCLLIAPDTQPTGHDGACNLEDSGFEIRDSIAWVRHADNDFWYVPKAATSERNAGLGVKETWTHDLKNDLDFECEDIVRETLELSEEDEIPQTLDSEQMVEEIASFYTDKKWNTTPVRLLHPTVKPIKIMESLLGDVPTDQGPVLDPFLGSGTTGIAALKTGHDFIGIEREEEYLGFADTRIRHWDREYHPWDGAEIESDVEQEEKEETEISLDDLFGV